MYLDFKELLAILNARKVRYLVVGGYAVSFHAQPRATKDLDLWVNPDLANATALYGALGEFGAPLDNLKPADFAEFRLVLSHGHAAIDGGYPARDQRRRFRCRLVAADRGAARRR